MHKVGDKVTHINYPKQNGEIVSRCKTWPDSSYYFLVLWENNSKSRHAATALKRMD